MTINDLINKYSIVEKSTNSKEEELKKILLLIGNAIVQGTPKEEGGPEKIEVQWQKELKEIKDYEKAMLIFYEMYKQGINKIFSSILSFHFASKVLKENTKSSSSLETAFCIRAISVFDNLDEYAKYLDWAKDGNIFTRYYKGPLEGNEYFDTFMMYNAFSGWSNKVSSKKFEQLKPLVINAERIHAKFSREEIINHGKKVSDAISKYIEKEILTNPHIPKFFAIAETW